MATELPLLIALDPVGRFVFAVNGARSGTALVCFVIRMVGVRYSLNAPTPVRRPPRE